MGFPRYARSADGFTARITNSMQAGLHGSGSPCDCFNMGPILLWSPFWKACRPRLQKKLPKGCCRRWAYRGSVSVPTLSREKNAAYG
jgi:hypothetical protein